MSGVQGTTQDPQQGPGAKPWCIRWTGFFTQSQSATVYCICTISFFFFFFFFFCQHFIDLYLQHDLTDFDQTWSQVLVDHPIYVIWSNWGQRSHRGHRGQKGHFTKNATPPTDYRVWSNDSCIYISLTPSTKVITLKIHPGSFGGHRGQKVIFPKNAVTRPCYMSMGSTVT